MLPAALTLIVIVVVIVGLISLARVIFSSGSSSSRSAEVDTARQALLDTTDGSSVVMSVRGPIVADENFRSYQISISPSSRQLKTFTGYLDTVLDEKNLSNSVAAYDQFVHALDKANMTTGKQLSDDQNDVRGICATGRVYEFEILKNGEPKQTLWTSTCSGSPGSLKANATQLSQLYQSQIPDSSSLIRGLAI